MSSESPQLILLSHMLKKLFGHDIADALTGSTPARIIPVFFQIVGVIEGNLLSGRNIPARHDPDPILFPLDGAIWVATVVDVTRQIAFRFSVEVIDVVEFEDVMIAGGASPQHFLAVDFFTDVLDHLSAFQNRPSGEQAGAVYPGGLTDQVIAGDTHLILTS